MLYELRIYHCMPGKLAAVVTRFETATVKLFEKHGIQPVGFWTVAIGESNADLYYILKWDSLDERQKKFAAFQADPDWIAVRNKSEEAGPIIASFSNTILMPTNFSALK
ncbi:NIPSNAP family protein [Candidatus Binatus sp.]|uniref:NIPSNAP family protein n=1 Tax=Candidatus Binatus sp. TaxID=2811406 RepID=UPI003BAF1FC1